MTHGIQNVVLQKIKPQHHANNNFPPICPPDIWTEPWFLSCLIKSTWGNTENVLILQDKYGKIHIYDGRTGEWCHED